MTVLSSCTIQHSEVVMSNVTVRFNREMHSGSVKSNKHDQKQRVRLIVANIHPSVQHTVPRMWKRNISKTCMVVAFSARSWQDKLFLDCNSPCDAEITVNFVSTSSQLTTTACSMRCANICTHDHGFSVTNKTNRSTVRDQRTSHSFKKSMTFSSITSMIVKTFHEKHKTPCVVLQVTKEKRRTTLFSLIAEKQVQPVDKKWFSSPRQYITSATLILPARFTNGHNSPLNFVPFQQIYNGTGPK